MDTIIVACVFLRVLVVMGFVVLKRDATVGLARNWTKKRRQEDFPVLILSLFPPCYIKVGLGEKNQVSY